MSKSVKLLAVLNKLYSLNQPGFHASMNLRFEGEIIDSIDGSPDFMENFKTVLMCYIQKYTGGILS